MAKRKKAAVKKPAVKPRVTITTKGDLSQDVERIFNDGVLLDLNIGFWSAKRRNTADDLGIENEDIPEFVVGLGTKRLVPKELSDSWQKIAAKARYIVRRHSFVFPIGETAFVPIVELPEIEDGLGALKTEFEKSAQHLWAHYDDVRDDMLKKFPEHRRSLERLYPPRDQVHRAFYFEWSVYNVTLPKKVQLAAFSRKKAAEDAKMLDRYRQTLESRMAEFLAGVVETMRAKVVELCANITERVKSGDVVSNRSLNSLRAFIDRFKAMNFVGDARIEDMLDHLKKDTLNGRDADAFKDDKAAQRALVTSLDELRKTAEAVTDISDITGGYKRRIRV